MPVTVATLNLHRGLDRHGRPFDVDAVLAALDADVVALQERQEAGDEVLAATRAAGYRVQVAPDTGTAPCGCSGVALLTRVPAGPARTAALGRVPFDGHRCAVVAEVDVDGTPVVVASVHLSHRLYGSPGQLWRLRAALAADGGGPAVLAGDFNLGRTAVGALLPGWRRVVRGRTFPAHRPLVQLDHVLVRDGVEVVEAAVLGPVGSDHRPARAVLEVGAPRRRG